LGNRATSCCRQRKCGQEALNWSSRVNVRSSPHVINCCSNEPYLPVCLLPFIQLYTHPPVSIYHDYLYAYICLPTFLPIYEYLYVCICVSLSIVLCIYEYLYICLYVCVSILSYPSVSVRPSSYIPCVTKTLAFTSSGTLRNFSERVSYTSVRTSSVQERVNERNIDLSLYPQSSVNNATHTIHLFPHSKIYKKNLYSFISVSHARTHDPFYLEERF
jgi:hypothetical protein